MSDTEKLVVLVTPTTDDDEGPHAVTLALPDRTDRTSQALFVGPLKEALAYADGFKCCLHCWNKAEQKRTRRVR